MNGSVHANIPPIAFLYLSTRGTPYERQMMVSLHHTFGAHLPSSLGETSRLTDYFRDLTIHITYPLTIPPVTDYLEDHDGYFFTALNHFNNACLSLDPETAGKTAWFFRNGYWYLLSSYGNEDTDAMNGWGNYLDPYVVWERWIIDRIRPFWKYVIPYEENWTTSTYLYSKLACAVFAPNSVVAEFYYRKLWQDPHTPLHVGADQPFRSLKDIQLLGPVLHMIGDSCVPQHVRPTLAYRHQDWENCVERMISQNAITADLDIVADFLSKPPFNEWWSWTDGEFEGKFAAQIVIDKIAEMTVQRLMDSTGLSAKQLLHAGHDFWDNYMTDTEKLHNDASYLYNLAVAGTVHAIVRAATDLIAAGIIPRYQGDFISQPDGQPYVAPNLDSGIPAATERTVPFTEVKDLVSFSPISYNGAE